MTVSWGHRIAILYTTFAAATIGFVIFAIGEHVDVVRPDYYEESLRRNDNAREEWHAEALGDSVVLRGVGQAIELTVPARFAGTSVDIVLYRPSSSAEDDTLCCTVGMNGRTIVDMHERSAGRWDVRATWTSGGVGYAVERKITVGGAS